jgi:hypothetical protein
MNFYVVLGIVFLILFIPIPLHLKVNYSENKLHFFIYGKKVALKRRVTKKVQHNVKSTDYIGKFKHYFVFFRHTLENLTHSHLKPKLYLNYKLNIGFEDALETAIVFGVLNEFPPMIYSYLHKLFVVKNYEFSLTPDFNDVTIDLDVNSILKISIANTIYIVIIILFHLLKDTQTKNSKFHLIRRNNYGKSSN